MNASVAPDSCPGGCGGRPSNSGGRCRRCSLQELAARQQLRRDRRGSITIANRATSLQRFRLALLDAPEVPRPLTRGDCENAPRPCPWVGCKHHLFLDVTHTGAIRLNFPGQHPEDLTRSCALDVAADGGASLDEVGAILGITRERIRQIEAKARLAMRADTSLEPYNDFEER